MQNVSFYDRGLKNAERLINYEFWRNDDAFKLDHEVIRNPFSLHEELVQRKADILIAIADDVDFFEESNLKEITGGFSRLGMIVIGKNGSYGTVRKYFINGVFDYLISPVDEDSLRSSVYRMFEDRSLNYIINELKLKVDALIENIFLGGGQEEFIISEIINQIYDDWNNDSVNGQLLSDKAKVYIYETLIERKPWLEKFLYKNDFIPHLGFSLRSKEELIKIWTMNFREASAMVTKYQMIDDRLVYKIGKYAVIHVDEKLSLDDVSRGVFLNASYISHIFKKITKMSFIDFMMEVKIDRAKVLLRDPEIRINEVAMTLGFNSQEYFTKNFKKKTGYTPSEFHKHLIEKYR